MRNDKQDVGEYQWGKKNTNHKGTIWNATRHIVVRLYCRYHFACPNMNFMRDIIIPTGLSCYPRGKGFNQDQPGYYRILNDSQNSERFRDCDGFYENNNKIKIDLLAYSRFSILRFFCAFTIIVNMWLC